MAEQVNVDIGRQQEHAADCPQCRVIGQRQLAKDLHHQLRTHGMSDQDDSPGPGGADPAQHLHQSVTRKQRTVAVIGIGKRRAQRGPGILHHDPRKSQVIVQLRATIQTLDEGVVEAVDKDHGFPFVGGQVQKRAADRGFKSRPGQFLRLRQHEMALRVRHLPPARAGDLSDLALGWN